MLRESTIADARDMWGAEADDNRRRTDDAEWEEPATQQSDNADGQKERKKRRLGEAGRAMTMATSGGLRPDGRGLPRGQVILVSCVPFWAVDLYIVDY